MIDLYFAPRQTGGRSRSCSRSLACPTECSRSTSAVAASSNQRFLKISPNNRIPAIVDHAPSDGGDPLSVFESGAILIYLAEKTGQLLPSTARGRSCVVQWVLWQMSGLGPMLGQHGHFALYAPEKIPYAIKRYRDEASRLYGVLDRQLAVTGAYVAGEYSIADIACFPWAMTHKAQGFTLEDFPAVKRWYAEVRARGQVQAGLAVGKFVKEPFDEEARRNIFGERAKEQLACRGDAVLPRSGGAEAK